MSSIQKSTEELIESVKSGTAYRRYRKCEKALKKYPGLSEKLDKYRQKQAEKVLNSKI